HNFVALSQWGNTIFGIMSRLAEDGGDPKVRASFQKTMNGNFDAAGGAPFTPLELFVMELFRVISPNGGSLSSIRDTRRPVSTAPLRSIAFARDLNGTAMSARHIPARA